MFASWSLFWIFLKCDCYSPLHLYRTCQLTRWIFIYQLNWPHKLTPWGEHYRGGNQGEVSKHCGDNQNLLLSVFIQFSGCACARKDYSIVTFPSPCWFCLFVFLSRHFSGIWKIWKHYSCLVEYNNTSLMVSEMTQSWEKIKCDIPILSKKGKLLDKYFSK